MNFNSFLRFLILLMTFLLIAPFFLKNMKKNYNELLKEKTRVGVISFKKVLTHAEPYLDNLNELFKDNDIKAIVLMIDCGGGCAGTSQTIFNEIKALKKQYPKRVVVFVENICASGAYYIACAADSIIASPSAFVGSIGVYISLPQLKEFVEQFKIKYDVIKTGTFKTAGDPLLELSPEQRAMLQDLTNQTYKQFIEDVAAQRPKLSVAHASQWAEGKVFTGSQALEMGLIDKTGSPATVIADLREHITVTEEIEWIHPSTKSAFSRFFEDMDSESCASFILHKLVGTPTAHT